MRTKVSFGTKEDLQSILDLDYDMYPIEGIIGMQSIIERIDKEPVQHIIAKDEFNNLQGYIHILSMTDTAFERILKGEWVESEDLIAENILPLTPNSEINCYITSIVTKDKNSEVGAQLLFGLIKYARLLSKRNISVNNVAAISFSKEGEILCEGLGFGAVTNMEQLSTGFIPRVYLLDLKKDNDSFLVKKIQKINKIK